MENDIFGKKLHFITGKGGVGKSTVAAGLARAASSRGMKTLLIELDTIPMAAKYLGAAVSSSEGGVTKDGIFTIDVDPMLVLEEFIVHHLRVKSVYRRILNSKAYKYFTAAAPGLRELMLLGKILRLTNGSDEIAGERNFEFIVVDSPATGHGVSMFQVPELLRKTFKLGILNEKSEEIVELLQNHDLTSLHIVTVPEEMPANEAVDLYGRMRRAIDISMGVLFINRIFPVMFSMEEAKSIENIVLSKDTESIESVLLPEVESGKAESGIRAIAEAAAFTVVRTGLESFYLRRLREEIPMEKVELPVLFREDPVMTALGIGEFIGGKPIREQDAQ